MKSLVCCRILWSPVMGDTLYPLVLEIDDSLDIKRKTWITCQKFSPLRHFHNRLVINSIILFFGKAVIRQANKLNFETHICMSNSKSGTRKTVTIIISGMVIVVVIIINMTPPIIITDVIIATQLRSIYMEGVLLLELNGILHRLIKDN